MRTYKSGQSAKLTETPLWGEPLVEIISNKRVLIENHQGIVAYGDQNISIKTKKGIICIQGACLELNCISKERIVITGEIHCVSLC